MGYHPHDTGLFDAETFFNFDTPEFMFDPHVASSGFKFNANATPFEFNPNATPFVPLPAIEAETADMVHPFDCGAIFAGMPEAVLVEEDLPHLRPLLDHSRLDRFAGADEVVDLLRVPAGNDSEKPSPLSSCTPFEGGSPGLSWQSQGSSLSTEIPLCLEQPTPLMLPGIQRREAAGRKASHTFAGWSPESSPSDDSTAAAGQNPKEDGSAMSATSTEELPTPAAAAARRFIERNQELIPKTAAVTPQKRSGRRRGREKASNQEHATPAKAPPTQQQQPLPAGAAPQPAKGKFPPAAVPAPAVGARAPAPIVTDFDTAPSAAIGAKPRAATAAPFPGPRQATHSSSNGSDPASAPEELPTPAADAARKFIQRIGDPAALPLSPRKFRSYLATTEALPK